MRLIDADALKVDFLRYVRTPPHLHYGDWDKMCISGTEIDEVVANAPTIDAEPVVHGYWIEHHDDSCSLFNGWECSECKQIVSGGRGNFCPNCGAKMDGGADDENA